MAQYPRVTIGVISFNRLRYLRALMSSAKQCIQYPNLQWIIVDGNSREPGLREYIQGLDFVDQKIFMECTHASAMNKVVELADGEFLMMLPEDVQFVVEGDWMKDLVEVASKNPVIGNVTFNYQRRQTIRRLFSQAHVHIRMGLRRWYLKTPFVRRVKVFKSSRGVEFLSMGNMREGICGSGIMSFMRLDYWKILGPWRVTSAKIGNDSSLGAEDDMVLRYFNSELKLQNVMMRYCVNADIVTDMTGTKARVRGGNKRYGNYLASVGGDLYYKILKAKELERYSSVLPAPGFEDVIEPIGFQLPYDSSGNLMKATDVDLNGQVEVIFEK